MEPNSEIFRTDDAAKFLNLAKSTLAKMRLRGDGPVFVKAGPRVVLYRRSDLEAWLVACRRSSTSDAGQNDPKIVS